jgi:Transposase DNA-binding/Transposase Tn5 dimerisation domain
MGWINEELTDINIGDERLDRRTLTVIEQLENSTEGSFTQSFRTRSELVAAYRLFDNKFVSPEKILSGHYKSTLSRIRGEKIVLFPNDTSSIDYTDKYSVEGLGILESKHTKGLLIHPLIAITPERICLGMIDLQTWSRDGEANRKGLSSEVRRNEPIEEKESFRWLKSYRKACELAEQNPEVNFVSMGDRESDILELIIEAVQLKEEGKGADIIIRINHDRLLANKNEKLRSKKSSNEEVCDKIILEDAEEERKLKKKLAKAPMLGEIEFVIPPRNGKVKRKVCQAVRAIKVKLNGKKVGDKEYPSVMINALCCIEEHPPAGENAICWMFFTTLPIDTLEQVLNVIKFYLCRWEIEVFFKILKSGCKVEERDLKTAERLKNMMAIFFILAWRIMYITSIARKHPEIPCSEIFEDAEWKSVCKIMQKSEIPSTPPSLGVFILMIARLGGYLAGKNRPPPGPKVIWKGMSKMSDYALAWESFGNEL